MFMVKVAKNMDIFKNDVKKLSDAHKNSMVHHGKMVTRMAAFESLAIDYYTEGDLSKRTFTHQSMQDFPSKT